MAAVPAMGALARAILERHYLLRDRRGRVIESPEGLFRRVAQAIAQPDEEPALAESRFFELMIRQEFMPNSPTLMNAGTPEGMLSGCFVLPLEDSLEGLYDTKRVMARILVAGGGVGMSFGRLPSRGDSPSYPVSVLESLSSDLELIAGGGKRQGAAMGMLPVWHADIVEFIGCKNTVAPTGTTSLFADCSSGLEPIFALVYRRHQAGVDQREVYPSFERVARERHFFSEELMARVMAHDGSCQGIAGVPLDVQRVFVTSHDISPEWHVRMQAAFQEHCDSAVSKTVNLDRQARPEDVERAFRLAWKLGCKGITVYREGSRLAQVLSAAEQAPG